MRYQAAGVDNGAARAMLRRRGIEPGNFASAIEVPAGMRLCVAIESLGTKALLLAERDRFEDIGWDAAAMAINDVTARGAESSFLFDHIMTTKTSLDCCERILAGIQEAASAAGSALAGGETAQLSGLIPEGTGYATVVALGTVAHPLPVGAAVAGDVIVGLPSSGPHANGFSLIRTMEAVPEAALARTIIYHPKDISAARTASHVTGGGLEGKARALLSPGTKAVFDPDYAVIPEVFREIAEELDLRPVEMRRVFNMGIGFLYTAPSESVLDGARVIGRIEASARDGLVEFE